LQVYSLSHVLMCARAHGLVALDGVCLDLDNPDELEAQLNQAVNMGFDGKTLIHPKQVCV
jgi:citrate lyase subunit beta/citryl-CoA lyase